MSVDRFTTAICVPGVVTTSPLKLEIQFEPVPEIQWFMLQAFVYTCKIDFTGNKQKQEVIFDYL